MTIKRNAIASYALALTTLLVLFLPAAGTAANAGYDNNVGVVTFAMNSGDVLPAFKSNSSDNRTVKYVRIVTATGAGKYYKLRAGTAGTGQVLFWETGTKDVYNTALEAGTTQTVQFNTNWTLPNGGLYLETDDTSTSGVGVYLYTAFGN